MWASFLRSQAWYAEFLLEIDLKITGARLIFKIALMSLHIDPAEYESHYNSIALQKKPSRLVYFGN